MHCVATDNRWWALQINALKFGCVSEERVRSEIDARRDCATKIFTIFGQSIKCGCCAEVNDTRRTAIKIHDCDCIRNAICANGFWIFIADSNSSLDAGIYNKWFLIQILTTCLDHAAGQLRHNGRQTDADQISGSLSCVFKQAE